MPINITELSETGIYQSKVPLETIARDMDEIDALRASGRKRRNWLFSFSAVALVAGVITTGFLPWIGVPILLGFAGLLYAGIVATRAIPAGQDRTNLVKGLVALLSTDASAKAPISVWISLDQQGTMLSEKPWPARKNGKERCATCEWLRLEVPLLDGTEFSQTITDFFRDRTYTNPRGKYKKKRRTTSELVQKYRFPPEVYGNPSAFPEDEMGTLIHLPQSATLRDLRVSEKALTARVLVKFVQTDLLESCKMLSLGSYRILNLARRLTARGTAQ